MLNFQQKEKILKKYIEILKKCRLFDGISDGEMQRMLNCLGAKIESFDKKQTVLFEESAAKYIGIVLRGSVQIIQVDYYGNRSILSNAEVSEMFAEEFACAEIDSLPVSVVANEPCDIMFIDCGHILHTCANNCDFHQRMIFNLMRDLSAKNLLLHKKIEVVSKRSTREKLMAYLSICAKKEGRDSFEIPFDRQELADYLEVERSGLSAEISKMKKEGIIDCEKNKFRLL